jgi:cytoskeletal protein CcmA (bactofilin family)
MTDNEAAAEGCAFFGDGVTFKGSISVPQKLVIHGTVEGDIESRELFVGPTGVIKGNVRVDEADVQGKIFENIEAKTCLRLGKTGQIEGKAVYGEIEIEKGGVLSGEISSIDRTSNPQTTPVQLTKAADDAVDDPQIISELVNKLNRTMRGWASYFNVSTVAKAYRAIDGYTAMRFRRWLSIKPMDMPQLVPPAKSETIWGSVAGGADAGSQLEVLTKSESKRETQEDILILDDTVRP